MRLPLVRAKELFRNKVGADASPPLDYRLNRVVERYILNGKFIGSMRRVTLAAPYGQCTLPRILRTLESARVGFSVFEIANRWYQFKPGSGVSGSSLDVILDLGDSRGILYTPNNPFPQISTAVAPTDFTPGSGTIELVLYTGVDPVVVTISGRDANNAPLERTLAQNTPSDNSSFLNPFAYIDSVKKTKSVAQVSVQHVSDDSLTTTPLVRMDPEEEESCYRGYYIPLLRMNATAAIDGFCKLRHIEFEDDEDILPLTNISALDLGLDAIQAEYENDQTLADALWNKGIKILNDELKDNSAADEIPRLQFIYPGRTRPALSSHY